MSEATESQLRQPNTARYCNSDLGGGRDPEISAFTSSLHVGRLHC